MTIIEKKWIFPQLDLIAQDARIVRESFTAKKLSHILIRESIQNSFDARIPGQRLRMVFSFSEVSRENLNPYVESLVPHLNGQVIAHEGKVLSDELLNMMDNQDPVDLLSIEDLGTIGLDGDTSPLGSDEGSNFNSFWWGEGYSNKAGTHGGRWGQGKTLYNMASQIHSFWGLTKRYSDSKELLMGKTLQKSHILDGDRYMHHGLYLNSNRTPISDSGFLRTFKRRFNCLRNSEESGLSIFIPYPKSTITPESITKAVLINYFYPILKNDLTIKIVEKNGDVNDVSNISIMEIVNKVDWSDTIWGNEKKEHIIDLFTFSKECIKKELTGDLIEISEEAASELKITEDIMKESCNLGEKMLSFNSGMLLGFRVPIIIQKQNGTESRTFFDIFLKKSLDGSLASSDVHYYRSGLSLPDEGSLGNLPVRGLFSAEDDGISEFLGDAEDPSHLKWNQTLEDLQDKYVNHYTLLRYIRNAMREIVRVLDIPVREKDYKLLNHIFSIPEAEKPKDELSDDESESDNGPDEKIQSRIREINISPISQGFIIKKVKRNVLPITIRVKVAYDVTRGSAFGTYDEHDFNLTDNTMIIDPTNCENIQTHENEITLTLIDRSSALKVSGFDPNRDLILNYNVVN